MRDSLTGNLLVASSLVTDPVFAGGVCLVVHQDDSHVIGVMLNRPMKPSPEALLAILDQPADDRLSRFRDAGDESDDDGNRDDEAISPRQPESPLGTVHFGGPRSGPVVAIHQTSAYAEAETGEGVYVAAQKQHLEDLVRDRAAPFRLFVGHLGWETDQLAAEIEAGIWHVVPATAESVFSSAAEMWPHLIRRATSCSMAKWIGIPDVVDAGRLN